MHILQTVLHLHTAAMRTPTDLNEQHEPPQSSFVTALWTQVITAGMAASPAAEAALDTLCRTYWYPLYAWARRQGYAPADAEDLVQGFFEVFLAKEYVKDADRSRGRFRSFLLASFKHYVANQRDRARAQKRGGAIRFVPLDSGETESRGGLFDSLKDALLGDRQSLPYALLAKRLSLTEGSVKVAVHRLRQRYRFHLREEIGSTVTSTDEVETELRHLSDILRAQH